MSRLPLRVALTGGIATGKSRCLTAFATLGASTIDADQLARDAVAPGTAGLGAVVTRFGPSMLTATGTLDRDALAKIVFADPQARRDLETIVHPLVYAAIKTWFERLDAPIGIADIPLLFETGHDEEFDVVIVAACRPEQQLARLMARNGLSVSDAQARIDAQLPLADKIVRADHVIDTSGTLEQTDLNTREVWERLENLESGI